MKLNKLFLIVGLFITVSLYAQEQPSFDSATTALAIDITNVSSQLEITKLFIKGFEDTDYGNAQLIGMDSLINNSSTQLNADFVRFEKEDLSKIGKASLDGLISSWNLAGREVENEVVNVRDKFENTTESSSQIRQEILKWKATYEVLKATDSPVELTTNVKEIIKALNKSEKRFNENLSKLVTMESSVNQLSGLILNVKGQLEIAVEERSKDIFKQNAPVLWKLKFAEDDTLGVDSTFAEEAVSDTNSVGLFELSHLSKDKLNVSLNFINSNQNAIYFHFILWVLTVMLSLKFGKQEIEISEKVKPTFALQSMVEIKHKLVLTATYVSIFYSLFLYDFIPFLIGEILVLTLILLNVLILKKSRGKQIVSIAILLAIVFLTGRLNAEAWLGDISYRLYLFAKIGLTYWVLKLFIEYLKSYKNENSPTMWQKLNKLANVTYGLLVVGVITNILGFVKMSDLSTLLVIQTIVVSFIFYGILVTSNGLVSLIFRVAWIPKKAASLEFRNSIEKMVLKVVNFFAALFWVKSVLSTVGIYEQIKEALTDIFVTSAEVGSVSISLQEIFYFFLVIVLTFSLTKFLGILITEGGLDRFKLERGVPNAISLVVRYTLVALGFLLAMSVAGIDMSSFSLLAGALGIGIGFGLQNIISNFVSGLILVFERPLQVGDVVEVSGLLGTVRNIGIRSSNIRTYSGSEVVVPNEALISKELVNWTLSDPNKRIEITIGVDYGVNPRQVIEFLTEAALANTDVQKDPAPQVYFEEFGDSSLNFRLLFWVHHSISLGVRSDVMLRVSDILRKNNINIPFPITTLKMDDGDRISITSETPIKDQRSDVDLDAGVE